MRPPTLAVRNGCALCARDVDPRIWVATKSPHPVRVRAALWEMAKPLGLEAAEKFHALFGLFRYVVTPVADLDVDLPKAKAP